MRSSVLFSVVLLLSRLLCLRGFSLPQQCSPEKSSNQQHQDETELSRRSLIGISAGALSSYLYGKQVAKSLDRIEYPQLHEDYVKSTIQIALQNAPQVGGRPLRILEVGIGKTARLLRRNLYTFPPESSSIELTGLDLQLPSSKVIEQISLPDRAKLQTVQASITSATPFPTGYFDSIICCLTLCSVDDPVSAVLEMKRLLRSDGGTLGYVEHVAVEQDDTEHQSLKWIQEVLEPLQVFVADNCHLHRNTDATIRDVFSSDARCLQHERFYVSDMWPVSCQSCGVLQRQG